MIDLVDNQLRFTEAGVSVPFIKDHLIDKRQHIRPQSGARGGPGMASSVFFGNNVGIGGQPQGPPPVQEQEKRIKSLTSIGASRDQAERLLKRMNWNADLAAGAFLDTRR